MRISTHLLCSESSTFQHMAVIDSLVISNTTAHNIDARNKVARMQIVSASLICRPFSILPEPGGNDCGQSP